MKSRNIKELLILLRDYIIRQDDDAFYGMCAEIEEMSDVTNAITRVEGVALKEYLKNNKPEDTDLEFWWPEQVKTPRIDWLNKQIRILENEE